MTGVSRNTYHAAENSQAEQQHAKCITPGWQLPALAPWLFVTSDRQQLSGAQVTCGVCVCAHMLLCVCLCLFWFFPPVGVLKSQTMQITPFTVRVGRGELKPTKPQGSHKGRGFSCPDTCIWWSLCPLYEAGLRDLT